MRVNIEEVIQLSKKRCKINGYQFDKIEWYIGGKKLDIPQDLLEDWEFTGLNNIDFISTGYYKNDRE